VVLVVRLVARAVRKTMMDLYQTWASNASFIAQFLAEKLSNYIMIILINK
jgi:hypothetical protein